MTTEQRADMAERIRAFGRDGLDVLILGGGVNGAGLFRDLCEQGLSCLIVDKGDFSSGTSAAPSRLIHGGLKYLETGEFGLVAQSTLERNLLLRNAPHCVEPLETFIPVFSRLKGVTAALRTLFGSTTAPRSRGSVLIRIGLMLYDFYGSRHRVMPRHRMLSRRAALSELPALTPRIVAGGVYHDAKISRPERLVWELVADGLATGRQAAALTDSRSTKAEDGSVTIETGEGERFSVKPRIVINAAGPWIDQVNAALGLTTALIGGTKGSHILLDHPGLLSCLNGKMIYFEADDGRILLVYPYMGLAMVGSTDIKAKNPDAVRCEDDETAYFLDSLSALLPGLSFSRDQIVYTYAGIRPLPNTDVDNPGLISRDHSTPTFEPGGDRPWPVIALVGGKWTTFRGFAEEVTDKVLTRLGRARIRSTRSLPIGGGRDWPADPAGRQRLIADMAGRHGISAERAGELLDRWGTTAERILSAGGAGSDHERLAGLGDVSRAEIEWVCRNELVVHLADIVMRRTSLAIDGRLNAAGLDAIAELAAPILGWTEDRKQQELAEVTARLAHFHDRRL